jgi:transposase
MRPLSEDLRQRIVAARADGAGTGEVCQRFEVSRSSVERFWNQHCTSGHCRPKQIGGYRQSRLKKHEKRLRRWIAQQADLTLVELQQRCQKELKVQIGLTALWHRLDRLGLSYKKNDARRRASAA